MTTHAHYAGEFGSKRVSRLSKDPSIVSAKATELAHRANAAAERHGVSTTKSDRASHALVAAGAVKKIRDHLKTVIGTEHESVVRSALQSAKSAHENITQRETSSSGYSIAPRKFDDRAHQQLIEHHKAEEAEHKSAMSRIELAMTAATPTRMATLRQKYETHASAAREARDARTSATRELIRARKEHTDRLRAQSAAKSEQEWARKRAEADSFLSVGRTRIAGGSDEISQSIKIEPRHNVTEVESSRVMAEAERRRAATSAQLAHRDKIAEILSRPMYGTARDESRRQVVSYAQKQKSQEEINAEDASKRHSELASIEQAVARNSNRRPDIDLARSVISLPDMRTLTPIKKKLIKFLSKETR